MVTPCSRRRPPVPGPARSDKVCRICERFGLRITARSFHFRCARRDHAHRNDAARTLKARPGSGLKLPQLLRLHRAIYSMNASTTSRCEHRATTRSGRPDSPRPLGGNDANRDCPLPRCCETSTSDRPIEVDPNSRRAISLWNIDGGFCEEDLKYPRVRSDQLKQLPVPIQPSRTACSSGNSSPLLPRTRSSLLTFDPSRGAVLAVVEAARNVACAGGEPIGATNCLNFGNPERPEIMWQFGKAVEGITAACKALNLPDYRRQRQPLQRN